jgi:predicted transposase YdaD
MILVHKIPKCARWKIEAMLKFESLCNTHVFQEGVEEKRLAAAHEILLRQITLKLNPLNAQVIAQIQAIMDTENLAD